MLGKRYDLQQGSVKHLLSCQDGVTVEIMVG